MATGHRRAQRRQYFEERLHKQGSNSAFEFAGMGPGFSDTPPGRDQYADAELDSSADAASPWPAPARPHNAGRRGRASLAKVAPSGLAVGAAGQVVDAAAPAPSVLRPVAFHRDAGAASGAVRPSGAFGGPAIAAAAFAPPPGIPAKSASPARAVPAASQAPVGVGGYEPPVPTVAHARAVVAATAAAPPAPPAPQAGDDGAAVTSNILVAVRCRPLSARERAVTRDLVTVVDRHLVVIRDPASDSDDILRQRRSHERRYAFDVALDQNATQQEVFESTTRSLIPGVVRGYNASVFAYGATGAGKTHTMLGAPDTPGCMVLALHDLFHGMQQWEQRERTQYRVTLSYVEVYNEVIRDLLCPTSGHLDLREDPEKGPTIAGVMEQEVGNTAEVMELLRQGNTRRTQEATAANQTSSRSHAVLQIFVRSREPGADSFRLAKLTLVDLAGSERASATQNRGIRLVEGANINRSLLALGNCINALVQNKKGAFVPYRDSKLTRLLKDSLGGNCRTAMIANISPSALSFEETLNTLKYANRAKNIKTSATKNVMAAEEHVAQYKNVIAELRQEVAALRRQLATQAPLSGKRARRHARHSGVGGSEGVGGADEAVGEVAVLRSRLSQGFQRRMQLRQALLDLDALIVHNQVRVGRLQNRVSQWQDERAMEAAAADDDCGLVSPSGKRAGPAAAARAQLVSEEPAEISVAREGVARLQRKLEALEAQRVSAATQLAAAEREVENLRASPSGIPPQHRELLELQFRLGSLEVEHSVAQRERTLAARARREKDNVIRLLLEQVQRRSAALRRHGVPLPPISGGASFAAGSAGGGGGGGSFLSASSANATGSSDAPRGGMDVPGSAEPTEGARAGVQRARSGAASSRGSALGTPAELLPDDRLMDAVQRALAPDVGLPTPPPSRSGESRPGSSCGRTHVAVADGVLPPVLRSAREASLPAAHGGTGLPSLPYREGAAGVWVAAGVDMTAPTRGRGELPRSVSPMSPLHEDADYASSGVEVYASSGAAPEGRPAAPRMQAAAGWPGARGRRLVAQPPALREVPSWQNLAAADAYGHRSSQSSLASEPSAREKPAGRARVKRGGGGGGGGGDRRGGGGRPEGINRSPLVVQGGPAVRNVPARGGRRRTRGAALQKLNAKMRGARVLVPSL